jgi:hypothetical protein
MKLYMNKVLSNGKTMVYIDIVFTNHIEEGLGFKTIISKWVPK